MLARYLKDLRSAKVVSTSSAISSLGAGWTEGANGAIEKQFEFADFTVAANFMQRYTEYCHKVNAEPEWSNVYNKVTVKLHNAEFNAVTTKEVNLGKYLDMVSTVTLDDDIEEGHQLAQVAEKARLERPSLINDQNQLSKQFYLTQ